MVAEYLPRGAIEASQHASIDAELKSLKLLSRRIQSVAVTHLAELQILRRLFYKNKNQHRGALFWRNIAEVRRFAEKLQKLDVLNIVNTFRNAFYGEENSSACKGPWTHVPSDKSMAQFAKRCDIAMKLSEKTSSICLDAYRMFHLSMQAGAFLQILLMFIAISSRIQLMAAELVEICTSIQKCVTQLKRVILVKDVKHTGEMSPQAVAGTAEEIEGNEVAVDVTGILNFGAEIRRVEIVSKSNVVAAKVSTTSTITRVPTEMKRKKTRTEAEGDIITPAIPKKKKRKVAKNEIDDIFGF